ncbi:hypothetical protein BH11MYX2_BH11MYX2_11920 [soil metagenome]
MALIVSAAHTQGGGAFGAVGTTVLPSLEPPSQDGVLSMLVPPADGSLLFDAVSPHYLMAHDAIPASENNGNLSAIHPRHDYFISVVDRQRLSVESDLEPEPDPREDALVPLYDPEDLSRATMPWASMVAGEKALVIGFPVASPPSAAFSVGRILSDDEARAAVTQLNGAGDGEGVLPYDAEVEFLVATRAVNGMSGGGAFDERGHLLGIAVRASTVAPFVIRVVRFTYVAARINALLSGLSSSARLQITPYLDPAML